VPKKKAKKYNLKSRITSALRRIWFYGPQRKSAVKIAKERGNTCAICKIPKDKLEIDHTIPVVPLTGFDDWQSYIDRLFTEPDGLRAICSECHKTHTAIHAGIRKKNKKSK